LDKHRATWRLAHPPEPCGSRSHGTENVIAAQLHRGSDRGLDVKEERHSAGNPEEKSSFRRIGQGALFVELAHRAAAVLFGVLEEGLHLAR
jgi:hypothetical protein